MRDEEAFFARYAGQQAAIRAIPYCQGYCYTQLTDVEQEQNGVYNYDRTAKVTPGKLAKIFGKDPYNKE